MLRLSPSQSIQMLFRRLDPLRNRIVESTRLLPAPRELIDFARVNQQAGREPLQAELSGLKLKVPEAPLDPQITREVLRYQYRPSDRYQEAAAAVERANPTIRDLPAPKVSPPILLFEQDTEVVPRRYQARLEPPVTGALAGVEDLRRVERSFWARSARTIAPCPAALPEESLAEQHHLLPSKQRAYLRESPLPGLFLAACVLLLGSVGTAWFVRAQSAEANAAAISHSALLNYELTLRNARSFGIPSVKLRPVIRAAREISHSTPAQSIFPTPSNASRLQREGEEYRVLSGKLEALLRARRAYWSWRAAQVYAALLETVQRAQSLGFTAVTPSVPPCDSIDCYRRSMAEERASVAAWNRELTGLSAYEQQLVAAGNAQVAAEAQTQEVANLLAIQNAPLPVPATRLSLADDVVPQDFARTAALAHFDAMRLQKRLVSSVRGPVILVSTADQELSCYARGQLVYQSQVVALVPPLGRYAVTSKEVGLPVRLWHSTTRGYRWISGSIPYRVDFSGTQALQAAPWRTSFGDEGLASGSYYTPNTTGSIDLPVGAAEFIYPWAAIGTPVLTY